MSKLTYIRCGDYDIPNLKLSVQPETSIGKYGRMRKSYLKEHRPILYNQLLMSEKLYPHLLEIDRTAQERMDTMLPHMMEAAGVTEELKACDPMRWAQDPVFCRLLGRRGAVFRARRRRLCDRQPGQYVLRRPRLGRHRVGHRGHAAAHAHDA